MTYNVKLIGDYDLVMDHIRKYSNPVQVCSYEDFNGMTMNKHVAGLGFKTEKERLQFLLEMSDKVYDCVATDNAIRWRHIPF
jgi:hypothetical protein